MSVNDERHLNVKIENVPDMNFLSDSQFQLQIAKSVASNGKLIFNTVWRSKVLAPQIDVKWKPIYGFNWTADVPANGISITLGGFWKQCDIGQVLDIDQTGFFVPSTSPPDINSMMIGKNNYKSDSPTGIRIIVGVQNSAGQFDPIFVDPVSINLNMSATFQPQEKIQWWYESGSKQSTMFTDHKSPIEQGDFSQRDQQTHTFKKTSVYDIKNGKWNTNAV